MSRLEKLRADLACEYVPINSSSNYVAYLERTAFEAGFDAAAYQYEQILSVLEGALEFYKDEQALQKLKQFKGDE